MYQRILVPIDGSRTSARGLEEAIQLAKVTGGRLRIVHLLDQMTYSPGYSSELIPLMRQTGEALLQAAKARATEEGVSADTVMLETHTARLAEMLLIQIKLWHAELVVLGTHGRRGISRLVLGSDAEQLARLSPVPVLLVHGSDEAAAAAAAGASATAAQAA